MSAGVTIGGFFLGMKNTIMIEAQVDSGLIGRYGSTCSTMRRGTAMPKEAESEGKKVQLEKLPASAEDLARAIFRRADRELTEKLAGTKPKQH